MLKIYEDHATLAFMDISPATRGRAGDQQNEHADLYEMPPDTGGGNAHGGVWRADCARCSSPMASISSRTMAQRPGKLYFAPCPHHSALGGDNAVRLWQPHTAKQAELRALAEQIGAAVANI